MIRLLSWNVRYFSHATRGITSLDQTQRGIASVIAKMDPQPDIIALQELDDFSIRSVIGRAGGRSKRGEPVSNFDRFFESLNRESLERGGHLYQAQFYPAQGHKGGLPLYSTGLGILYRSSLQQVDHNGPEPHDITHRRISQLSKLKQKRICAWGRFRDGEQEFDVFNTHLSLPAFLKRASGPTGGRFGESDNQVKEIESLLDFVSRTSDLDATVLVGDFNALPGSRVYSTVAERLRDAHATHIGAPPDHMVHMHSAGFMNLRYRLDHVFAGRRIQFHDFHDTAPYGRTHPWVALSDHSPLVGRFSVLPRVAESPVAGAPTLDTSTSIRA
ncbi:MAG: endonuclease/exonuclease/phosphatase family protein [Myxococcales bacterium]|nr:endonuclease/exonuclease/phosphatase family protein [Myxococcales bacterium]